MIVDAVLCCKRKQFDFNLGSRVKDIFSRYIQECGLSSLQEHDGNEVKLNLKTHDSLFYYICNGKRVCKESRLQHGNTYHMVPRVLGGKGGFGSMLRAIGAQIEKTTSREACRDLSGRRMRDINNEKKLKEWLAKEVEREQEREERKKKNLEKHLRPQHKFDDAEYHEQKAKVQEDLQDALSTGLKRKLKNGDSGSGSQPKSSKGKSRASKAEWLGVDLDSDDMDSDSDSTEADPGPSSSVEPVASTSSGSGSNTETLAPEMSKQSALDSSSKLETSCHDESNKDDIQASQLPVVDSSSIKKETDNKPSQEFIVADVPSDTPVDMSEFSSSSELQALGLDRLKHALMARCLKCGGTLEERAERLWAVRGLTLEEIRESHPALLAKGGKGKKSTK